jgi:hypothetical protein
MDRMMMPPATRPMPPNFADLTPEEQQALLAQGWNVGDDGSLTPPQQPKSYDLDAGGFGAALGGPPATSPAGSLPSPMGPVEAAPDTPFPAGPELNARIEFGPEMMDDMRRGNPMMEAMPEPFEVPEVTPPLRAQPGPDLKAAASASRDDDSPRAMPGRMGRRMQNRSTSRPATSRRSRR